jgi:hypothetical protein
MLEITAGALIGFLIGGIIRLCICVHSWNSEQLRYYREEFFAVAERLLQEDELDDERLVRLEKMNQDICSKPAFKLLRRVVDQLERERKKGSFRPPASQFPPRWEELVYNYFSAVSHIRVVRGVLLRARLFGLVDPLSARSDAIDRRVHAPHLDNLSLA